MDSADLHDVGTREVSQCDGQTAGDSPLVSMNVLMPVALHVN